MFDRSNFLRLLPLILGIWLHGADSTMMATLAPGLVAHLESAHLLNWTFALYQLGSILAGASCGLLIARRGTRMAMIAASLVYACGCVISALAGSMEMVLAGRLVQGLGGGGLVAISYVAVTTLFEPRLVPRLMGMISAVWGAAALFGPLLGGLFAEYGWWRGAFWFLAAQAIVLALAALILLARRTDQVEIGEVAPPLAPVTVLAIGILMIAGAGIEIDPIRSPLLFGGGLVALWLFLRLDARRTVGRLLPHRPIDPSHPAGAGILMVLTLAAATMSFTVYGPLLMTTLHGATPLMAGYMVAAGSLSWSVSAIVFPHIEAIPERVYIRLGAALVTLGLVSFTITMPSGPLIAQLPGAVLESAGFGMMWGFVVRRVVANVDESDRVRASTLLPTAQLIGYALGSAACGLVAAIAGLGPQLGEAAARSVGFWIFAAFLPLALIGNLAAWRLTRDS